MEEKERRYRAVKSGVKTVAPRLGGGFSPPRRVAHKNRKSADRRSPITENTAAVCGHTVRAACRCWIAITPRGETKRQRDEEGGIF